MDAEWWQRGVLYQVYPRSFQDSDGDGTGDLRGIAQRLDYLTWLGVDSVWTSPIYPSPMTDFGYDISDYCAIDPLFGTLADFDALLDKAHALGLKLILDYVPNHTSDQHPWFQESRDRSSGKAGWYLWRDAAAGGGPPNNWLAQFGGPAWTWDAARGQYYMHSFLPTQPDLNWRNPAVRAAMYDVLRFWLRRGVDGFRVDVMWLLIKDDQFHDNPPDPDWREGQSSYARLRPLYTSDRPEMHEIVAEMHDVLDEFHDRVLIGELYLPIARLVTYYGQHGRGAQLPFNFSLLLLKEWTAEAIAALIRRYEAALPEGAWPNWVLGNHDRSRVASRIGAMQARVAAMLLLTLRGTPTIYMGEELGMVDTPIPESEVRDPAEKREPGKGLGRDPERTPFPWDKGPGAGFTTGKPWLRLGADTPLSVQQADPHSMVSLYHRLIALRRAHQALALGAVAAVAAQGPVLTYSRLLGKERFDIALNTGGTPHAVTLAAGAVLADTQSDRVYECPRGARVIAAGQGIVQLTMT